MRVNVYRKMAPQGSAAMPVALGSDPSAPEFRVAELSVALGTERSDPEFAESLIGMGSRGILAARQAVECRKVSFV